MASRSIVAGLSKHLLGNLLLNNATRCLTTTAPKWGADSRDKRKGHVELSDRVEGEQDSIVASTSSYELIDERLMDRVINGIRFRDIPIVNIICTRNNTKINLIQADGQQLAIKSAGTEGYKNCRKGTTVAAQAVANRVVSLITDNQIDTIRLVFNGLGPGRNAAYKVFEISGLNVVSLTDRTEAVEPFIRRPRKAKRL